jgi:Family of unknown function (DUF5636)
MARHRRVKEHLMWITSLNDQPKVKERLDVLFAFNKDKENEKKKYHPDFASILALLSDRAEFEALFHEVSQDLEDMYRFGKEQLAEKNALTAAFVDMFNVLDQASEGTVGCAFKNAHDDIVVLSNQESQNVTLTGNALNLFGGIVSAGYLFKDATGPSHGEYAHSLQWLVIAYAKYYDVIKLTHGVLDLYKNAVGLPFSNAMVATLDATNDERVSLPLPYWSFLVDCFRSSELNGLPEKFGVTLFVENYRSPSYLTDQMLHRRLRQTFLGTHLQKRDAKRSTYGFETGSGKREAVRAYTVLKQRKRKTVVLSGETTNATAPKHLDEKDRKFLDNLVERTKKNGGLIEYK